jgi:hypothetical protein
VAGLQAPLTTDERDEIVLAAKSVFKKLKNLYEKVAPIFQDYGFTPPSAGVIARDLSEKIEKAIIQHSHSFTKGTGHCDLSRMGANWEVKVCKDSGLTINQSKQLAGENYIVVNYTSNIQVRSVWVLWNASDVLFSPRKANSNARSLLLTAAQPNVENLFSGSAPKQGKLLMPVKAKSAKAGLSLKVKKQTA